MTPRREFGSERLGREQIEGEGEGWKMACVESSASFRRRRRRLPFFLSPQNGSRQAPSALMSPFSRPPFDAS